jgi:cell division protein FtsN
VFVFLNFYPREYSMQDVFEEDELKPALRPRDTEITLGPVVLFGLGLGLVVLCALCFGLGYSMGGHSSQGPSTNNQPSNVQAASGNSLPKPSPAPQNNSAPPLGAESQPASGPSGAEAAVNPQDPGSTSVASSTNSIQPVVKPALPDTSSAAAPTNALMVQIAAVSHQEDADVLAGALRKHGYSVTEIRDAADNLIHVRVGPFSSRNDANAMRIRLLNDGYNAIVQP